MSILVCGEALVDIVPITGPDPMKTRAILGGAPFNVAIGLARLDIPTGFLGKISSDGYGVRLFDHLVSQQVDVSHVVRTDRPTTVARVATPPDAEPEYAFQIDGTADRSLRREELPAALSETISALHFGSYSLALEPTASALMSLMEREHGCRVITLDPNVRPGLIHNPGDYRRAFAQWCALSHIIKLSESDLAWIDELVYPEKAARRWLSDRTQLVVFTRGSKGARAYLKDEMIEIPSLDVSVADTVGAGDAFMSGLLAHLYHLGRLDIQGLAHLNTLDVRASLETATRAAAITCSRPGAHPPTRRELAALLGQE